MNYYEAVGLFLDEYLSIDSIKSIAYGDASGMISARFTPDYWGK
jgi:hypothetical protein